MLDATPGEMGIGGTTPSPTMMILILLKMLNLGGLGLMTLISMELPPGMLKTQTCGVVLGLQLLLQGALPFQAICRLLLLQCRTI